MAPRTKQKGSSQREDPGEKAACTDNSYIGAPFGIQALAHLIPPDESLCPA
jgi:hypothetical protein